LAEGLGKHYREVTSGRKGRETGLKSAKLPVNHLAGYSSLGKVEAPPSYKNGWMVIYRDIHKIAAISPAHQPPGNSVFTYSYTAPNIPHLNQVLHYKK
jgi:hypothetical protein